MSGRIIPIQPVSRIEPINRVSGIGDMDPGLYQILANSLYALFQRVHSANTSIPLPPLPTTAIIAIIQPRNEYRGKKRKNYSKKNKRDFQRISSFFKKIVEQE